MAPGRRRLLLFVVLAAGLVCTAATCRRNDEAAPADRARSLATSPVVAAAQPAPPPPAPSSPLAGIDLSTLPESARAEVMKVATDEFCYCGCPHTLGGCLKEHAACKHSPRMTAVAAILAEAGSRAFEIITTLGKYHRSFRPSDRKKIDVTSAPCRGNADAPVTLVEFADFECPSCGAAHPILEGYLAKAQGKVRLCFKNYPLPAHPNATWAAYAAELAHEKGKFWEMHDVLFEHQEALRLVHLKDYAKKLGLDAEELEKAITTDRHAARVNSQKEEGRAAGVESTPSIFVNGRPLSLPLSATLLAHAVEDELEWQKAVKWNAD